MGILLRDVMKIPPFSEAKLVAGHEGILREVVSANIQEVPSIERWVKRGEILFTAGYAFRSACKGCEMMERLNEIGVAALAIKPGQYLPQIPNEMIECANRLALPLLELPEDMPYMDCILAIFEQLTQKQFSIMRQVEEVRDLLTQALLNKEGLLGICSILNRISDSPVFITSSEGALLSYKLKETAQTEEEYAYFYYMQNFLEGYFKRSDAQQLQKNVCNTVVPKAGIKWILVPIFAQEERFAHLVLDIGQSELTEMHTQAFEQAGSMIAVELLKEQALWRQRQKIKEQLLEDLLSSHYRDENAVMQRGFYLGFDLSKPYCLFVIDADSFEETLKKKTTDLKEEKVQRLKAQVLEIIHTNMSTYPHPNLISESGMGVVGMVFVQNEQDVTTCINTMDSILQKIGSLGTDIVFSAGVGQIKQGLQHIYQGKREAHLAMRAGRRLRHHKALPHTHAYAQLGCLCFLSEQADSVAMRDFYEENLRVLLDYDKQNNADLVKTLDCFFICRQNLRVTAESLYVHKNSVIYRLNKVESLLQKSISDHQTAFNLQLCLLLRNLF